MLKIIGVLVLAIVVVVLVMAAMKPDTFVIQRSTGINAPPEKVYALIYDFNQWAQWSPWEQKDPAMKRTMGNTSAGLGATYAWVGNKDVGEGNMAITGATPPTQLVIALGFIKPFEAKNKVVFDLKPEGADGQAKTQVNWAMYGDKNFISKLMQVFMNIDTMVGKDFESGLAKLKAAAERSA